MINRHNAESSHQEQRCVYGDYDIHYGSRSNTNVMYQISPYGMFFQISKWGVRLRKGFFVAATKPTSIERHQCGKNCNTEKHKVKDVCQCQCRFNH